MASVNVVVTGDALLGYELTVTNSTEGDYVRVRRVDSTSHYPVAGVRGLDMIPSTSGPIVITDYEAPLNTTFKYLAETFLLADLVNPSTTYSSNELLTVVPAGFAIITDVLAPDERVAGAVLDFSNWTRKASILGKHKVLGRALPVTITDKFSGRSGSLVMSNLEHYDVKYDIPGRYIPYSTQPGKWSTIFDSGSVLLFRSDYRATGFDDCYMVIESVDPKRLHLVGQNTPATMAYTITFSETDRPATAIVGLGLYTWNDLLMSNNTWNDLVSKYATWQDVLNNPTL